MTHPQWQSSPESVTGRTFTIAGRRFGAVALAAIAAGVLAIFGISAAVIPSLMSGGGSTSAAGTGTGAGSGTGAGAETSVEPTTEQSADGASPTASPSSRASSTPAVAAGNARLEDQVLALVNSERRKARCEPVRMDERLRAAARTHSADMALHNFVNHTGSDGSSPEDRMRRAGYGQGTSENLARGQRDADDVMRAWMHDRGDRANIVDCDAKAVGIGVAQRGRTLYWTQDFGR